MFWNFQHLFYVKSLSGEVFITNHSQETIHTWTRNTGDLVVTLQLLSQGSMIEFIETFEIARTETLHLTGKQETKVNSLHF